MTKTPRMAVTLKKWRAENKKKTDPTYSGRLTFTPAMSEYLANCLTEGADPELFLSLWVSQGQAVLGLAVPKEYAPQAECPTMEDLEQWMQ